MSRFLEQSVLDLIRMNFCAWTEGHHHPCMAQYNSAVGEIQFLLKGT